MVAATSGLEMQNRNKNAIAASAFAMLVHDLSLTVFNATAFNITDSAVTFKPHAPIAT